MSVRQYLIGQEKMYQSENSGTGVTKGGEQGGTGGPYPPPPPFIDRRVK